MTVRYIEMLHEKKISTCSTIGTLKNRDETLKKTPEKYQLIDDLNNMLVKNDKNATHNSFTENNKDFITSYSYGTCKSTLVYNRYNFHHACQSRKIADKENINQDNSQKFLAPPPKISPLISTKESFYSCKNHWRPW